jgi:heme-degrading monooxygenase HmoA
VFTTIWECEIAEGRRAQFEAAYGTDGEWVRLFRQATGFRETVLAQILSPPLRYITLDRWTSRAEYEDFRKAYAAAYSALDEATAGLTLAERHLGTFDG